MRKDFFYFHIALLHSAPDMLLIQCACTRMNKKKRVYCEQGKCGKIPARFLMHEIFVCELLKCLKVATRYATTTTTSPNLFSCLQLQ
jgi:hypothetical protein